MSGYVKNVVVRASFDGDTVTAVLKPITFIDRVRLEEMLPGKDDPEEDKARKRAALWKELPAVVGPYMVSIEGLRDSAGAAIDIETVTRDGYFVDLIAQIWQGWFAQRGPQDPVPPAVATTAPSAASPSP